MKAPKLRALTEVHRNDGVFAQLTFEVPIVAAEDILRGVFDPDESEVDEATVKAVIDSSRAAQRRIPPPAPPEGPAAHAPSEPAPEAPPAA